MGCAYTCFLFIFIYCVVVVGCCVCWHCVLYTQYCPMYVAAWRGVLWDRFLLNSSLTCGYCCLVSASFLCLSISRAGKAKTSATTRWIYTGFGLKVEYDLSVNIVTALWNCWKLVVNFHLSTWSVNSVNVNFGNTLFVFFQTCFCQTYTLPPSTSTTLSSFISKC